VHNATFSAFIEGFTSNTYIMVITSDRQIQPAMTLTNLTAARAVFEDLLNHLSEGSSPAGAGLGVNATGDESMAAY
jgi:Ras-related GTP-binding protein A/B